MLEHIISFVVPLHFFRLLTVQPCGFSFSIYWICVKSSELHQGGIFWMHSKVLQNHGSAVSILEFIGFSKRKIQN